MTTTLPGYTQVQGQLKELIRETCGFYFNAEREDSLIKAVKKRMSSRDIPSAERYLSLLQTDQGELNALVELLTINETYFFREPEHLKLVIETLIPELLAHHDCSPLKIVSAGCSTGEEPYSVAMLLREKYGAESARLFKITGIDIDAQAISAARNGIYGKPAFRGMDAELLNRYFEPAAKGTYRISETIKQQTSFEVLNLLSNAYPPTLCCADIIMYRNVSIYFPQEIQQRIFGRLAELLNEGGALVVGASETLHHDTGILTLQQRNSLFYFSKPSHILITDRRAAPRHAPLAAAAKPLPPHAPAERHANKQTKPTAKPAQKHVAPANGLPRELFDQALALARDNRHEEALDLLETILGQERSFIKAHGLKASLLLNSDRHDEARNASEQMLALDPLCREAYLMLGIIARHQGDDGEAFKRFREALYLDASCWLAHFYTAEIMFSRKESKRARSSYETVLSLLESGPLDKLGQAFFPLAFNPQQYISVCRHKLSLLKENR